MDKPLSRAIKKVQRKKIEEAVPSRMTRRNVRSQKYRTKTGAFDQAAYDADKDAVGTKKGGGRPRKKGGALATTTGSSVQKTGSSSMTTTNKNSGVTKAEPEAKDQTINVKATEVGGDLAQSKVGSMSNSGKKEVDPNKNDVTRKKVGQKGYVRNPVVPPKKNKPDNSKNERREKARERLGKIKKIRKDKRTKEINKENRPLVKKAVSKIPDVIGGAAAAYGKSSFNVKEGKTFAQFVDDAVILDEGVSGYDIMKGNVLGKALNTAAPYIRKGLSFGANILRSTKLEPA